MKFKQQIAEHTERTKKALSMGGEKKLEQRRKMGILNARERIERLFDPNTFLETGLFSTSANPDDQATTPADGKITGVGKINGKMAAVVANDFTVKGASSSPVNSKKIEHMKELSRTRGIPLIFLGESSGGRIPDVMGSRGMIGGGSNPIQYMRKRESPWVSAVLGPCYGSSTWYTVLSDFVVMRKGATLAVSSPKLVSTATGEEVDPEELGGWRVHAEITGIADVIVDRDEEAIEIIKKYLSYVPSNQNEAPERAPVPKGSDEGLEKILDYLPESRSKVYDVRKIIQCIVDKNSFFELKSRLGKSLVTAFSRIDGRTVGIIANNPIFKGGAIDVEAAEKATSFIVQCDSFNIPLVFLVDQPGFLIGLEAERRKMPGKIMNWMNALTLCTVPKIAIIMRKSYGQAFLNMGGGGNAHEMAAWWTAEISFMDPNHAVNVLYGLRREDNPEQYDRHLIEITRDTTAYSLASIYGIQNVIDPRETRNYLKQVLEVYANNMNNGIGKHLMAAWPTTY